MGSSRQARHGFTVCQARAGFEYRVFFHMMRHTACSNLYALPNADFGASRSTDAFPSVRTIVRQSLPPQI
jgi:hypothetical protein